MKKGDKTRIVIGSCNVYSSEYTGAIEEILTVVKNLCV